MKWVFFCVIEINWNFRLPAEQNIDIMNAKKTNKKKQQVKSILILQENLHFIRKPLISVINFCSICFDYAYEHLCPTVYSASIIANFCKLNSLCDLCTNIPFRAFNRFYDKLLINEKFIETNWTRSHPWKHTLAITHLYSSTQFSPSSAKLSLPFSCKDRLGLCFIYFPLRINPSVRIRWVRAR